jgi:LysM repeat protein
METLESDKIAGLDKNYKPAKKAQAVAGKSRIYRVRRGDTLSGIAYRHKVSLSNLMKANNLTDKDAKRLRVGQKLTIPAGGVAVSGKKAVAAKRGKAVKAKGVKTTQHGVKAKDGWVWASLFAIHDGRIPRGTVAYRVKKIPQDEKYHWYKIPQPLNCANGFIPFWGLYGFLNMDLSTLYRYVDGREDMNIWDIYFSVKFTGPAWVKGSTKENAVWLDRIVAVWHYAKTEKNNQ